MREIAALPVGWGTKVLLFALDGREKVGTNGPLASRHAAGITPDEALEAYQVAYHGLSTAAANCRRADPAG
jgi:hypothetical protein